MFRAVLGFVVLAAAACASPAAEEAPTHGWHCDASPLLVTNVRRVGESEPTTISIANGRITAVGAVASDGVRTLDGGGATVLPGLIDSHTHYDALPAAKHLHDSLDPQLGRFPATLRQTLASGVTASRTHLAALGDIELLERLGADDCVPAPRIEVAGPGLLGGAPEVNSRLMRGVSGAQDARDKLQEMAELGAGWVALHGLSDFPSDELAMIRRTASELGIRLMADTDAFADLAAALPTEVVSGEYINRTMAPAYPDSILELLRQRSAPFYFVPPIGYYRRSRLYAEAGRPPIRDASLVFFSPEVAAEMRRDLPLSSASDTYVSQAIAAFGTFREKFDQLTASGAIPVLGTDAGSLGQFHADAVWHEMRAWMALGRTFDETLRGATVTPAEMLGRPELGHLGVGARGDLVLLAEPGSDGPSVEDVRAVVKGGVVYLRDGEWVGPSESETVAIIRRFKSR